jgi:hypothetical protein
LGVPQDYQKANQLYTQAIQLGSADALYRLGGSYQHGTGVEMDLMKSFEYYTHAAMQGIPIYQFELGRLYEGVLTPRNLLEALKWYTKAYLQGYDDVSPKLNAMYKDKPYEDFFFFFKKLFRNLSIASCGNLNLTANYTDEDYSGVNSRLGSLYLFGQGTVKDLKKAWKYITMTQVINKPTFTIKDIYYALTGFRSSEKHDILKEFAKDVSFRNERKKEHLYEIGMIFFDVLSQDRTVIEMDYSGSFKCLEKAADQQHTEATIQLGTVYTV